MDVFAEIVNGYFVKKINARQCNTLMPCGLNALMAIWTQMKKLKASSAHRNTGNAASHGKWDGFSIAATRVPINPPTHQ